MTLDQVKRDLNELFSDTSVSRETTRNQLIELRDEIEVLLNALGEDEEGE